MDYEFSKSFTETLRAGQAVRRASTKSQHAVQAQHPPVTAEQYHLNKTIPLAPQRAEKSIQAPTLGPKQASAEQTLLFTARPDFASRINDLKTLSNRVSLSGPAFSHTHGYSYTNSSSLSAAGQETQRRRSVLGKTNRLKQWEAAKHLSEVVPTAGSPDAYCDPRGVMHNALVESHALDTWRDHLVRKGLNSHKDASLEHHEDNDKLSDVVGIVSHSNQAAQDGIPGKTSDSGTAIEDSTDAMPFDIHSTRGVKPRTLRKMVNMPWRNSNGNQDSSQSQLSPGGRPLKSRSFPAWWPQQPEKAQTNTSDSTASAEPANEDLLAVRKATAVLAKELGNLNTRSWFRSIPPPASCSSTPCTMTLPQFLETLPNLGLNLTHVQTNILTSMFFSRKSNEAIDRSDDEQNGSQVISKPIEFNHLVSRIRTDQPYVPHITKYSAMMGHIGDQINRRDANWPKFSHEQAIELLKEHLLPRKAHDAKALGLGQRTSYKHVSNALSMLNIGLAEGELDKLVQKLDASGGGHINISDILAFESQSSHRQKGKQQHRTGRQKDDTEDDFDVQRRMIDPASRFKLGMEPKTRSTDPAQKAHFADEADKQVRGEIDSVWNPGPVPTRFGRTYEGRLNSARVIAPGLDDSLAHLPFAKANQINSEIGRHMDVYDATDRYKPRDQAISEMQAEDRAQRQLRQERIVKAKQAYENEVATLCDNRAEASVTRSEGRRLGLIATRLQFCEALEQRTSYSSSLDT